MADPTQISERISADVPAGSAVLLYDGYCGLCNRSVRFVLRRDRKGIFYFAAQTSVFAQRAMRRHGISAGAADSVFLLTDAGTPQEHLWQRSNATVGCLRLLGGAWAVAAGLLRAVPLGVRDFGYRMVARNRYRIFGRYDACPLPPPESRTHFLD